MADEIVVELDGHSHSLDAVNAAAYRLIDVASCRIETCESNVVCHLSPKTTTQDGGHALRNLFLDYITDECLRERIAAKTEPVRNLILSLAFGSLASSPVKAD